jgi:hypothetical protein
MGDDAAVGEAVQYSTSAIYGTSIQYTNGGSDVTLAANGMYYLAFSVTAKQKDSSVTNKECDFAIRQDGVDIALICDGGLDGTTVTGSVIITTGDAPSVVQLVLIKSDGDVTLQANSSSIAIIKLS